MSFRPAIGIPIGKPGNGDFVYLTLDGQGPNGNGLVINSSQWPVVIESGKGILIKAQQSLTLESASGNVVFAGIPNQQAVGGPGSASPLPITPHEYFLIGGKAVPAYAAQ